MNIITKNDVAIYRIADEFDLPSDGVSMIEVVEYGSSNPVLIGGGDVNANNSVVHEDVFNVPEDFIGGKYLYDGVWTLNPDYTEES